MSSSGARIEARFDEEPFALDVDRYRRGSPARRVADAARRRFERDGVPLGLLLSCAEEGRDRTRLGGLVKIYLPAMDEPADDRPFGMVFDPIVGPASRWLSFVAFGTRHQPHDSHAPTVYALAHRRLHGRWPPR
jgi:hypothetical protein